MPAGPWGRTWLVGLALAVALLGGAETFWRAHGHRPSIADDPVWWAMQRYRLSNGRHDTIALLGNSRMQLGIDTATLRQAYPDYTIAQLAVNGTNCFATLEDLAADDEFCGTVVANFSVYRSAGADRVDQALQVQTAHRGVGWHDRLNHTVGTLVQSRLVVLEPRLRLSELLRAACVGTLPAPTHVVTLDDRSQQADFRAVPVARLRAKVLRRRDEFTANAGAPHQQEWLAELGRLRGVVERIEARGGHVIFAELPVDPEWWRWQEEHFPRSQYWDRLASATGAATLHYRDVGTLRDFHCPDASHLDQADAPVFTRALIDELARRDWLPSPGGFDGGERRFAQCPSSTPGYASEGAVAHIRQRPGGPEMPSVPANAHSRLPTGPWGRTWLVGLALAMTLLGGVEAFWRFHGHRPSITDDHAWWAMQRARLSNHDPHTIALLGNSRMQLDVDTATLRRAYPDYTIVQLAVSGESWGATLRDLADDAAFCGTIIANASPYTLTQRDWDAQAEYVAAYHAGIGPNTRLNRWLDVWYTSHLVLLQPQVGLRSVLQHALQGELPPPAYAVMLPDRSRRGDYTQADLQRVEENAADRIAELEQGTPATPDDWLADARKWLPYVVRLQARGVQVVFVEFPISGPRWDWQERCYPRNQFWNRLAAATGAATLHFRDVPTLAHFECPDTSHLDQRDAPAFTAALVGELARRGVLAPPADLPPGVDETVIVQGDGPGQAALQGGAAGG